MWEFVVREYLAESIQFSYPATYQLGRLGSEIQNDDFLLHKINRLFMYNNIIYRQI